MFFLFESQVHQLKFSGRLFAATPAGIALRVFYITNGAESQPFIILLRIFVYLLQYVFV